MILIVYLSISEIPKLANCSSPLTGVMEKIGVEALQCIANCTDGQYAVENKQIGLAEIYNLLKGCNGVGGQSLSMIMVIVASLISLFFAN